MWDRAVDGRILRFRLVGVNNQNLLLVDEETGSWWQQITGECILGPLKGQAAAQDRSDEVSLATWRAEQPESRHREIRAAISAEYPDSDWEKEHRAADPRHDLRADTAA